MNFLRRVVGPAFALLIALTVITGAVYPAVVTAIAQVAFPSQANGSFITTKDGRVIGSSLIGQVFDQLRRDWARRLGAEKVMAIEDGLAEIATSGAKLGDLPGWLR